MPHVVKLPLLLLLSNFLYANNNCPLPPTIEQFVTKESLSSLKSNRDIARNFNKMSGLCIHTIAFREGNLRWKMLLVNNPKRSNGAFYFIPHDNENSAFDTALYAIRHYGGGFLAVVTGGKRYNFGQDPNRNFSNSTTRICSGQKAPSPLYTSIVFATINYYKSPNFPYIALHNNTNGGGISVLKSSKYTKSYLAYPLQIVKKGIGLADEDSLIYIAGSSLQAPRAKVARLLNAGLNVKYEIVNRANNDCSMSNYLVLERGSSNYYNIEAQHGKRKTQIIMLQKLLSLIY